MSYQFSVNSFLLAISFIQRQRNAAVIKVLQSGSRSTLREVKEIRAGLSKNTNSRSRFLKALPLTVLMVSMISLTVSADIPVSSNDPELEFSEPFSNSDTMPQHFSSGSSINFRVFVESSFHENAEGFDLYRKKAGDTAWNNIESQNIQSQWTHGSFSTDADFAAWYYFPDKTSEQVTLNEGDSSTITCDGQEVQIAANTITDSSPGETTLEIGGTTYSIFEGEYLELPGCSGVVRAEEIGSFPFVELQLYYRSVSPSDGHYRYKASIDTTGGDIYHSESIYFDVSGFNNDNYPYIEKVEMGGQRIYDFQSLSGISPGETVYVDVIEREGDAYNVTLEDRGSGLDIQRQKVNQDGSLEDLYSAALDFFIDPFVDTSSLKGDNSKRLAFKITPEERDSGVDLFGQDGTYSFGFSISDQGRVLSRKSLDYTLTTDGTAYAPNITAVEGSGDCSTYSPLSSFDSSQPLNCIRVTATDQDTEELFVGLNLTEEYDNVDRNKYEVLSANWDTRSGDQYIFNLSKIDVPTDSINASGTWTASVKASDSITSDNETVSWNVPWGQLRVERVSPVSVPFSVYDNESFSNSYRISCGGGPECVNQNESVQLQWDPFQVGGVLQ